MIKNINKHQKLVNSIAKLLLDFNKNKPGNYIADGVVFDSVNNTVAVKFYNHDDNPMSMTVLSTKQKHEI